MKKLCQTLDCPRSSYYYKPKERKEGGLLAAIEDVMMRWPRFGYRRIQRQLGREGINVGERVVRRLLNALGGSHQVGRLRVRTTDSNHPHRRYPNLIKRVEVTHPDQLWVADITFIRMGRQFIYLAVILDVFTRSVRGWALSRHIDKHLTLNALRMALRQSRPLIFHSDQGVQYAASDHVELLQNASVKISMSDAGQPTQNAVVERFIRTFKEEHVDFADYDSFSDAQSQIQLWLEDIYNKLRMHSSLDYLTPAEFEAAFTQQQPSLSFQF